VLSTSGRPGFPAAGVMRVTDRAKQGLFGGTIQVFLAEMLILPVGLAITAYLTRRLGAEAFGVFGLATALISWLEWSRKVTTGVPWARR
jgi:hypothetical protein